jgi:hypothetical protein
VKATPTLVLEEEGYIDSEVKVNDEEKCNGVQGCDMLRPSVAEGDVSCLRYVIDCDTGPALVYILAADGFHGT